VIALPAGALTAAPAGVRQDGRICLGNAPSPRLGQFRVEPVPDVAFHVQRKFNGAKEVMLKFPRALPDYLADIGVLRHPRRQQLLAISECLATSRAHPAQLNAQLSGQTTQGPAPRIAGDKKIHCRSPSYP
jgi:hypothetical protein